MYTKNQRWYIFICSRTTPTTTAQNKRLLTIESHNHRIVRKYYLYLVFFVYFFSAAHFFSLSIHPPIHCTIIILLHMEFYILWIICFLLFVSSSPFGCFVTLFFGELRTYHTFCKCSGVMPILKLDALQSNYLF